METGAQLTFAKTSGTVKRDRELANSYTDVSPVAMPETTAGCLSAQVPFFVSKVTNSERGQKKSTACYGFELLRLVIGYNISRHFVKPLVNCLPTFSCLWLQGLVGSICRIIFSVMWLLVRASNFGRPRPLR